MTDNPETKHLDPAALASPTTGVVLCDFSSVHEAAEHVIGHPVWTHEFGSQDMSDRLAAAVRAQFPEMPTRENAAPWEAVRDDVRRRYGETVAVQRGSVERAADPITTLEAVIGEASRG